VLARVLTRLAAGLLLALTFPSAAAAEWHFTPTIGWTFAADTNLSDPDFGTSKFHWNFGGSVALLGAGILGVEGTFVWTPGFFSGNEVLVSKSHAVAMMGNVVLTTPRKWTEYNLRPLLSGGFGFLGVSRTENLFPNTWNTPAFNIGGGAFQHSTLLKLLNSGNYAGVPAQMRRWIHAHDGSVLPVLVKRRETEIERWKASV